MRGIRGFLVAAAAWDAMVGAVALVRAGRRGGGDGQTASAAGTDRAIGVVVLAFAVLYAVLAVRPDRRLLLFSALAKVVGGMSGAAGLLSGTRDALALLALADAAWVPGFLAARSRLGGSGRSSTP